jgi:hypothetical protein
MNAQIGQFARVMVGTTHYSGEVVYITENGHRAVMTATGAVATGPTVVTI